MTDVREESHLKLIPYVLFRHIITRGPWKLAGLSVGVGGNGAWMAA